MTTAAAPWQVRRVGEPAALPLPGPQAVLDGLRDGDWEPTDEVRGPGEAGWSVIEEHPALADAVAEMGPPPPVPPDETHLDMNPLIDVSLVLLIFFILTAAVTTLRRTIDVPPPPSDDKASQTVKKDDVQDRVFNVKVSLDAEERPVVAIENRVIAFDDLDKEVADVVKSTGRKEMYLSATDDVPWEVLVKIHGAANEAGVRQIYMRGKK